MGFSVVHGDMNFAYQILEHNLPIPEEGQIVDIEIGLYPESRKFNENTLPVQQTCQQGKIVNNQIVYLSKRVCIPFFKEIWKGDAVVEIIVNGKLIYRDKAKYGKTRKLGVEEKLNCYTIDQIYLNPD